MDNPNSLADGPNGYYQEQIGFLTSYTAPQYDLKMVSAHALIDRGIALQEASGSFSERRWPPAKDHRERLAELMCQHLPSTAPMYTEWKAVIRSALENVYRMHLSSQIPEWADGYLWEELLQDVYSMASCSIHAVRFYQNDKAHLSMNTSVFLVPAEWNSQLASLISGCLLPAWVAPIEVDKTPNSIFGQMPSYTPLD